MNEKNPTIGDQIGPTRARIKAARLAGLHPGPRPFGLDTGRSSEARHSTSCGIEYDLYAPPRPERTIILVPDLAPAAERAPAIVNLARALAETGVRAAVIRLPALAEHRFGFIDVDAIVDLVHELSDQSGGRVGVIAFGFGAGLAARAAYEKEVRDLLDPLVLVNPYYDLAELARRMARWFAAEPGPGSARPLNAFIRYKMAAAWRDRERLGLTKAQSDELAAILNTYQDCPIERKTACYRLVLAGRGGLDLIPNDPAELGNLSPAGLMEIVPGRAVILHDPHHDFVPVSHAKRILAELEECPDSRGIRLVIAPVPGPAPAGRLSRWRPDPVTRALAEIFRDDPTSDQAVDPRRLRALRVTAAVAAVLLVILPIVWYVLLIGSVPTVTPEETRRRLAEAGDNALLIDVRPATDYDELHIAGAVSRPYDGLLDLQSADQLPDEFNGKALYLYCSAGLTSARVADHLRGLGVREVFNVRGGLQSWYSADPAACHGKCALADASGEAREIPYRFSTPAEQWTAALAARAIPPGWLLLAAALLWKLRRARAPQAAALRWALLAAGTGEIFRITNHFAGTESYFLDHLYHSGLALAFGFAAFTVLPGRTRSSQASARPGLMFLGVAGFVLALLPIMVPYQPVSYQGHVLGALRRYDHPMLYQMFEFRFAAPGHGVLRRRAARRHARAGERVLGPGRARRRGRDIGLRADAAVPFFRIPRRPALVRGLGNRGQARLPRRRGRGRNGLGREPATRNRPIRFSATAGPSVVMRRHPMKYQSISMRSSRSGFTLLEFLIVLFVVGILAAIAIPDFLKFCGKPKQSEAKNNLGAIYTAQSKYFDKHGTYAGGPECFELIGWGPEGDALYSYYCEGDVIPCTKHNCTSCAGRSELPRFPESTATGFTVYAVGNVDRETSDCDVWSLNDAKNLKNDVNDISN